MSSWAQPTSPLQQPQQTPMQQQQHPAVVASHAPPTSTQGVYFGKTSAASIITSNLLANSMQPSAHASGASASQPPVPLAQQPTQLQQSHQHAQGYFNNHQQQQPQHWQQPNYLQDKMMQSTPVNWQQQQQQNSANANIYQPHAAATATTANSWQQPALQAAPVAQQPTLPIYGNYYAPTQQQPPQQQYPSTDSAEYYQQPLQTVQAQQPAHQQQNVNVPGFYDNSNGNNNSSKTDGWGDWDWNDNSNISSNELPQQQQQQHHQQQQQHQQHQQAEHLPLDPQNQQHHNSSVIADSFSNDNWAWNTGADDTNFNVSEQHKEDAAFATPAAATCPTPQVPSVQDQQQTSVSFQVPQQQQPQKQQPITDFSVAATQISEHMKATVAPKPTSLPLQDYSNDNYNNISAAPTNNIPNSVYVSQAKPVSRPPRQYASPPGGATPAETPENTVSPPQAFQNELSAELEPAPQTPAHVQPPPPAITPLTGLPPAASITNSAGLSNPFKRAGAPQHHRAGLLPTTKQSSVHVAPITTFSAPPPPADFANALVAASSSNINLEPDNLEILHENQEVISAPTPLSLPATALQNNILLPTTFPPPNDERNQYLQTSHLSENPDEELNVEGDNNLPPPGLSRLVLGQPEVEASQRLVTGTEQPSAPTTNMHMEERQADGEDTSVEPLLPSATMSPATRVGLNNTLNAGANPPASATNIDITADRNLYLVPGESNAGNEQRVVTGLETTEATVVTPVAHTPLQVMNEQREIELDGENLNDQQPVVAAVSNRNEPPLEGASSSANLITVPAEPVETQHYSAKSKDHSNVSTGNDESEPHQEHYHASRYAGNKTRKHANSDKSEKSRRGEKQRSMDRYESEEEESAEFSSERERERRHVAYREGSVRSERDEIAERDYREKRKRRDLRDSGGEREKPGRDKHYYRGSEQAAKTERRSQRYTRYDNEAEESVRPKEQHTRRSGRVEREDRGGRSDRSDRDYDEYNYQRGHRYRGSRRGEKPAEERRAYAQEEERPERRGERRHPRRERDDYDTIERRRREKLHHHPRGVDAREYEEYRKQSSRNARDSDLEKERARAADPRFDPRLSAMYGYSSSAYGYDPYTYYYEQMARTNPQAYAEWYKKYYGHAAALSTQQHGAAGGDLLTGGSSLAATDGRESVHSGRSSAHNEKDRYTQAYISQANEYHRHFQFHHHHQQQQQQQQQRQLAMQNNMSLNSTMLEDASSIYGGRLSAARSTSNLSQIHSTTAPVGGAYYAAAAALAAGSSRVAYAYARSDYADSRSGNISLRDAEPNVHDPQRLTPSKFGNEHAVVSLSAGILVTVKPKYSQYGSVSNIVKLHRLGANDATRQLYQAYPGPLVRGLTHKKTIIEFCEEQIRLGPSQTTIYAKQLLPNNVDKYKASYTLMWNLLILLLRQNGMVVGTDIAELLLKNQQQYPYHLNAQISHSSTVNSKSDSGTPADSDVDEKLSDVEGGEAREVEATTESNAITSAKSELDSLTSVMKSSSSAAPSEADVTEKFRNYLLYGNVNEALDWATDNNLWGHALFLASKLDRRSHANVMMKFANKLSLNDPLQTLYQLMSGRTPSSVTSVQDEKWGDWRPHLSMILSNTSQKPELDRKAITTLGDSLFNRGDLFAAHFCYLMAQVGFGRYQEGAAQESALQQNLPKLVLLGSSHYKNFRDFASNEAIMMTEIYEYACSLNDGKFSLVEFQPYKYLMATRLLDYGYNLRSLMYMEQLAVHIERDSMKYEPTFIQKVYEFADRLKYCDPVLEKTLDDQQQNADGTVNGALQNFEEQKWLQNLRAIATQHKTNYNLPTSAESAVTTDNMQSQIDQQFVEINKQFNELNLQYNNTAAEATLYNADPMQQQQVPQIPAAETNEHYSQQPAVAATDYDQQQQQQQQQHYGLPTHPTDITNAGGDAYANYAQHYMQPVQEQQQLQQQNSYFDPSQHQPQSQYNVTEATELHNMAAAGGSYDYWAAQQQQQQQQQQQYADENAKPTISMPKSKAYDSDDDAQKQQQLQTNASEQGKKQQSGKNDSKELAKSAQHSNQNSGWFGGIWNKLSLKPKNQMILPDDKNPAIVWDAAKKRWVNTDGGEEATEDNLKPPPKMSDLMSPSAQSQPQPHAQQQQLQQALPIQQQQQQLPPLMDTQQYGGMPSAPVPAAMPAAAASSQSYSATAAATPSSIASELPAKPKTPSLQSNMFKMQRNRTLKNSYVDVFNPSGAPMSKAAENVLAPAVPPAAVPPGGYFIPGAAPMGKDANAYSQQQPEQHQQQQDVPQFYNPNQYGAGGPTY